MAGTVIRRAGDAARRWVADENPCWVPPGRLLRYVFHSGEWRNRQTRRFQVSVFARTWGFKSPLAH